MRPGSIVILTAALLLAPVLPLASPAAAASQPVVSSVSPGSGPIGTLVTITGSGFNDGCTGGQSGQVYFGGILAANATVTDGAATAVAPTHRAGAVNVMVADCLGDLSAISSADTFVYPAPAVSSVSPGSGMIGTLVTITGSGFNYGCTGGQSGQVYFHPDLRRPPPRRDFGGERDRYRRGGHSRRAYAPRGGGERDGGGLPRRFVRDIQR